MFIERTIMKQVLKMGSEGTAVRVIQQALFDRNYRIDIDGDFGKYTSEAVRSFQHDNGLPVTGIVDAATHKALDTDTDRSNKEWSIYIDKEMLLRIATKLEINPAMAYAIVKKETGDFKALQEDGSPKILYERHIMHRMLLKRGLSITAEMAKEHYSNLVHPHPVKKYGTYAFQYERLEKAKKIHEECAIEATSYGAFQILGMHWDSLGYDSPHQFESLMYSDVANQIDAFIRFVLNNTQLHKAMQATDFVNVARYYNGPGYLKNNYDSHLREYFREYRNT